MLSVGAFGKLQLHCIPPSNYTLILISVADRFVVFESFIMEQINTKTMRHRRSKQQIQDLLTEFEQSKTTAKDFCRQHNISAGNFYKWKSRYGGNAGKKTSSGFTVVDVVDSPSVLQGLFAEVKGIKIYQAVSASFLKALL